MNLISNKTKKVTWSFNPKLFNMFRGEAKKEGKKPTRKIEELILIYLEEKKKI